ncbi:MAG: SRPBCC domain-containing protein [Microbacteriaceae bacterium]|nr:SRPBCC domain-containing protein [Microbacteriaceae bacterium]MCL2795285.1 SRPBCC domain-containing protein [Microbacteriaceae bacterium]
MPILADTDILTGTIVSVGSLAVPPAVAWRGFAERELLERWYGPADTPAHFEHHVLAARCRSLYRLDGGGDTEDAGGARAAYRFGFLQFIAVEPQHRLVFTDGTRTADDVVGSEFLHATVEFEPVGTGTRMFVTQHFVHHNDMEQLMLNQFEAVVSSLT